MTSYNLRGQDQGSESVYDYTRRRWNELRDNFAKGKSPGVTNDKNGAFAASKLIYVEMQKNPGIVTDGLPPDATYLESYINNPTNPLTWIAQKTGQAAQNATHTVALNLDKPAQLLQEAGNALPWYTKPGPLVALLAASILLPPLFGKSLEGIIRGMKGRAAKTIRRYGKNA
jgi:hypothetical protein